MTGSLHAGFDLGGTRLKYGLIDAEGAIVHRDSAPSPDSIGGLLLLLENAWAGLQHAYPGRIETAGFGFAGFFSLGERKILASPNYPSLDDFDIVPALQRFLNVPFRIDNDANMAAFGEWMHGAGRGARSLVLLTVGTGIGSGIVLDGGLWHGKCGFAGELGHITVNPEGSKCGCGNIGCLETEASAPKIVRNYADLTGKKGEGLSAKHVYERAKEGDPAARMSFARSGYYLGIALGIVINFLNPEKILLGGGVMTTGEFLMGPAVEEARRRSHPVSFACTTIEKAGLGNDAGFIGAASWARTRAGGRTG